MLQMERVLLFVFVCMLLQTGTANTFDSFYHVDFRCEDWLSYTTEDFVRMASNGFQIGGNMRICRIFQGRPDQACGWYVKYNINGFYMNEWTGLDSEGEPWGTGCCSSESNCATALGAGSWLKERHKDICCGPAGTCWFIVVVDRWTWGYPDVILPTSTTPLDRKLDYYVIHHTATPECSTHDECMERVRSIQDDHMNEREMWDIEYNFLIGGNRSYVYKGRGWHTEGAHAKTYNARSIGIAIIGNYATKEPHDGIIYTLKELMKCGVEKGIVKEDYALCGHLDLTATMCPGNSLLTLLGGDEFAEGHACVSPYTQRTKGACGDINFVGRSTWGANSPKNTPSPLNQNLDYYIIHHTDTPECSTQSACSRRVKSIQNHHMNTKGWNDIGYSFLIGGDNQVYEGRGWDNEGAHARGFNNVSIGIAIIGDYTGDQPESDVVDTLESLMMCGVGLGKVKTDYNACVHSDFSSTECPGDALRNLVHSWRLCDR